MIRAKPETLAAAYLVFLVGGWRHLGRGGPNVLSTLRPETPKTLGQTLGVSGLAGQPLASAEGRCGVGFQFQYFVWCQNCTAETFNFHALRLIFVQFVYNCTLAVPEAGKVCHRAKPETLAVASAKHLVFLVWGWRHLGRGGLNAPSALRPETPKTLGQTLGVSGLAGYQSQVD